MSIKLGKWKCEEVKVRGGDNEILCQEDNKTMSLEKDGGITIA